MQNSLLQKGLIFDAPLDEWSISHGPALTGGSLVVGTVYVIGNFVTGDDFTNVGGTNVSGNRFICMGTAPTTWTNGSLLRAQNYGTRERINNIVGVGTDIYNLIDRENSGKRGYSFDGVNDYIQIPDDSRYDFGTGDFSICMEFLYYSHPASGGWLLSKGGAGAIGYNVYINIDGRVIVGIQDNNGQRATVGTTAALVNGTRYRFACVFVRSGNVTIYINGVASGTGSISNVTGSISNEFNLTFGAFKTPSDYARAEISMVRLFNLALTSTQAANYSKPEYQIERIHQTTNTNKAAGGGTFSDMTGWLGYTDTGVSRVDAGGGDYKIQLTDVSNGYGTYCSAIGGAVSGATYRCSMSISDYVKGGVGYRIGNNFHEGTIRTSDGTFTEDIVCTDAAGWLGVLSYTGSGTTTLRFDNLSQIQLGCILNLNAEGVNYATNIWRDRLNNLSANVYGATYYKLPSSNLKSSFGNGSTSKYDFTASLDINNVYTISIWAHNLQIITYSSGVGMLMHPKTNYYLYLGGFTSSLTNELITIGQYDTVAADHKYSYWASTTDTIPIGWHHYVFVWDGSKYQIYMDNVAKTTSVYGTPTILSASELYVPWSSFNGLVSNLKMWNRSLSIEEISRLYQLGE